MVAIIDIDCSEVEGFDKEDEDGLQALASLVGKGCDWEV